MSRVKLFLLPFSVQPVLDSFAPTVCWASLLDSWTPTRHAHLWVIVRTGILRNSLVIQWLGVFAFIAEGVGLILVGELVSHAAAGPGAAK